MAGGLGRFGTVVVSASQILLQSSDCDCNGIRVMPQRGLQIPGPYKFADQLLRGFRKGKSNDFAHLVRSTEAVQGNQTAKERPAADRQSTFDPEVVVRWRDIGDVSEIDPICLVWNRRIKIVLPRGKIKGSAPVHFWTPHRTHRPLESNLPRHWDFRKGELIGRIECETIKS
jgi:hypothetical protein